MGRSKETVEILIEKGSNINVQDYSDYTPLMHAIWYNGTQQIAEMLIDKEK